MDGFGGFVPNAQLPRARPAKILFHRYGQAAHVQAAQMLKALIENQEENT